MSSQQTIGRVSVLLPNGVADIAEKKLAPRLKTLAGMRQTKPAFTPIDQSGAK